jgi:DNA ligase-1
MRGMIRFCKESLDNDETPVLLGYSLGKSQELLCGLADAGLPIVLHGTVYTLTKVYEQFGHCFPAYEKYQAGNAQGKVVLCPPSVANSAMLRNLGKTRCAVLTGWAVDPGCKYRSQCDAAFPISDHADFPELIEFVQRVQPKKVYTLHGFAADFAATLRGLGFEAHALSEDEQMRLGLEESPRSKVQSPRSSRGSSVECRDLRNAELTSPCDSRPSTSFLRFAENVQRHCWDERQVGEGAAARGVFAVAGPRMRSGSDSLVHRTALRREHKQSVAGRLGALRDALCSVAGVDETELHHVYLKHSDLGETAFELFNSEQGRARFPQRAESRQNDVAAVVVTRGALRTARPTFVRRAVRRCWKSKPCLMRSKARVGLPRSCLGSSVLLNIARRSKRNSSSKSSRAICALV